METIYNSYFCWHKLYIFLKKHAWSQLRPWAGNSPVVKNVSKALA